MSFLIRASVSSIPNALFARITPLSAGGGKSIACANTGDAATIANVTVREPSSFEIDMGALLPVFERIGSSLQIPYDRLRLREAQSLPAVRLHASMDAGSVLASYRYVRRPSGAECRWN